MDNRRLQQYYSHPISKRSVKVQTGTSFIPDKSVPSTRSTNMQTPTKKRKGGRMSNSGSSRFNDAPTASTPIHGLPGKKTKEATKRTPTTKVTNKCQVCGVIYKSKKDLEDKRLFKRQNEWIACDSEGCDYWGHARCFNVKINKKNIKSIPFRCPLHTNTCPLLDN